MSLLDELEKEEQNITESDMDEEETNTTQAKVFQETISSGTEKLDMFYNSFGFVFVNLIPLLTLIVFFFKKKKWYVGDLIYHPCHSGMVKNLDL